MIRFWNLYARCYDTLKILTPYQELISTLVDQIVPTKRMRILDAGCGTGNLTVRLNQTADLDIVAVDLSPAMLDQARRKLNESSVIFKTLDLSQPLPFADDSFDVVVSNNVIYALPDPQKTMNEFRRILKKGGRLVISTPANTAKIGPIISTHIKKRGLISLAPIVPSLMIIGLFNLIILKRSVSGYHFFNKDEITKMLPEAPEKISRVYANQNWLVSWRKK